MAVKPNDRPQTIAEFSKLLGIDKIGTQVSNLPSSRSSSSQRAAGDAVAKAGNAQKTKANAGAKAVAPSKAGPGQPKNVSSKGSWALVIAGLVLASVYATYHISHREQAEKTDIDGIAQGGSPSAAVTTPQPVVTDPPLPTANDAGSASAISTAPAGKPEAPAVVETPAAHAKNVTPATSAGAAASVTAAPKQVDKGATAPAAPATAAASLPESTTPDGTAVDNTSALFRLSVKPWATVMVDGVAKGVSPPLKRLILPEGKHQIKLVNPNFPEHAIDVSVNSKKRFGVIEYDFTAH